MFQESTRLNVYDNKNTDNTSLSGSFYKINNDRDTFYLANVSDPDTVNTENPTNHYFRVGANTYSNKENASLFAYKPIISETEIKKSVDLNISDALINRFKNHGRKDGDTSTFLPSFDVNKFIISKNIMNLEAEIRNKRDTTGVTELKMPKRNVSKYSDKEIINKYKTVINSMKEEPKCIQSQDLYDEMIIHSEAEIIKNSFRYYLVAVEMNGSNRDANTSFENNNILSKNNVSKHSVG